MYTKYIYVLCYTHGLTWVVCRRNLCIISIDIFLPFVINEREEKNIDEHVRRRWVNSICICIWLWYKSFQSNIVWVFRHPFLEVIDEISTFFILLKQHEIALLIWKSKNQVLLGHYLPGLSFCYYMYFIMLSFTNKKVAMLDLHSTAIKHYRSNRLPLRVD